MRLQTVGVLVAALLTLVVTTTGCGTSGKPVGMIVIYEVDAEKPSPGAERFGPNMRLLTAVIDRRLNPGRGRLGRVRQLDDGRIEVSIFRADLESMQRIADRLPSPGTIEFRVLANRRDHGPLIEDAVELEGRELRDSDGSVLAWWVPVARGEEEYLFLQSTASAETVFRKKTLQGYEWTEYLVVKDVFDVNGSYLLNVREGIDQASRLCVLLTFNHRGGQLFSVLTGDNRPDEADGFSRHLGIILDGHLKSAPAIQATFFRQGQITGNFTREEVQDLVNVLNAGSLPVAIRKVEQRMVDTEKRGSP